MPFKSDTPCFSLASSIMITMQLKRLPFAPRSPSRERFQHPPPGAMPPLASSEAASFFRQDNQSRAIPTESLIHSKGRQAMLYTCQMPSNSVPTSGNVGRRAVTQVLTLHECMAKRDKISVISVSYCNAIKVRSFQGFLYL